VEVLEGGVDWASFELVQRAREGFLFRYRDFLVRDRQLFVENWRTIVLDQTVTVAGRLCQRYRVERTTGEACTFELSVDAENGLVLAFQELDERGEEVAAMVYESVLLDPDLRSVIWHVPANEERRLDPLVDLTEQIGTQALEPRLLPEGCARLEAATVEGGTAADGAAERWLKLTYTDGVEPVFFFQRLDSGLEGSSAPASASRVTVFQVGSAVAIQGRVDGFDLIVIGKASEAELLDLIESALP
jgi:hypothetical protein